MQVSVFGLGYVGCVTAACLARMGHQVIAVDVNPDKVAAVREGRAPIVESGLGELLADVVGRGRLKATADAGEAVRESDIALICVGTPSASRGEPSLDAIERVAVDIGRALNGRSTPFTVVLRSTVLPGTTEGVLLPALREAARDFHEDLDVAINPEFMREGSSLEDFDHPPFVLIGGDAPAAAQVQALYAGIEAPLVVTALRTAELVKYASNAFHGLKVCFANEIGAICDALGADAQEVMEIVRRDRKLNASGAYLKPGFAFGGSCLPKDLRALLFAGRRHGVETPLLSAILPSNSGQVQAAIQRVLAQGRRRVGVVGLAFKHGTDDLRESPVVTVVESLIGKGYDVRVLDRHVAFSALVGGNRRYIESEIPHIASLLCRDPQELVAHAEVLVIGTAGPDATDVLALSPDCPVIDLTRSGLVEQQPEPEQEPAWASVISRVS